MVAMTAPVFFGWKVVGAASVFAMFAFGVGFYGPAVFLSTLHQTRGWPVSVISAAVTAHFLLSAALVAHLAEAHRRFGIVAVTRAGIVASVIGLLGWSMASAPWQLFGAALLTGAGWAATSGAAINAMVSPWFDRRRAMALGHAFNGASIGGVLFTPLWVVLIAHIGFVGAASVIGLVTLAALWPLAGRFLRPTPASLGVAVDGGAASTPQRSVPRTAPHGAHAPYVTHAPHIAHAIVSFRDRRLATLSAAFALGLFAQIGLVAHLVTRLAAVFGPIDAAAAVSLTTACAVIGRLLLGACAGTADRRVVAAVNLVMQASGVTLLAFGSSAAVLLTGCVLFGLGIGNLLTLPPLIAQQEFAPAQVGRVVALVTAVNQAVFAFAPLLLGLLYGATHGYTVPFAVVALVQVIAAGIVLLGRHRKVPA
jgi:MFS family permease